MCRVYTIYIVVLTVPKNVLCLIYDSDGRRIKFLGIGIFSEYSCSENTHLFGMRKQKSYRPKSG